MHARHQSGADLAVVQLDAQAVPLRWTALVAWAGGIATYHVLANLYPAVGATLPSLLLAGVLHAVLSAFSRDRETVPA